MKTCTGCLKSKDESEFPPGRFAALSPRCHHCHDKDRQYKNSARGQARIKAWKKSEAGKQAALRNTYLAIERHPQKFRARTAVNNALRDGRLLRQPCEVCGATKAHAHHEDYNKPLEVNWLCRPHHMERHRSGK